MYKVIFTVILSISFLLTSSLTCEIGKCKMGYRLEKETCLCVSQLAKQCSNNCSFGRFLNSDCNCAKRKECPILECSHGYKFIYDSCECETEYWNVKECLVAECYNGFILNDKCECVGKNLPTCMKQCKNGKTIYPGSCECQSVRKCHIEECIYPASPNNSCECEMPQDYCDITCPPDTVWEFPCQCVSKELPELKIIERPQDYCDITCPPDTDWEFPCQCVPKETFKEEMIEIPQDYCGKTCPPDTIWEFPCQCVSKETSEKTVGPDPSPASSNNCPITQCKQGLTLHVEACQCIESTEESCNLVCSFGFRVYPGLCECIKPYQCEVENCKSPAIVNSNCECEFPQDYCDLICPEGTRWEFPCQCVTTNILPHKNKTCLIDECQRGFKLDSDNCSCVKVDGPTCRMGCPIGFVIYPGECKCVEPYECNVKSCLRGGFLASHCVCEFAFDN